MRRFVHWLREDRGSTAVEFALLLPALMTLLIGVLEGGRVLNAWVVLSNETREAARYGVAGVRDGDTNLITEVNSYAQGRIGQTLDTTNLTVTTTVTPPSATDSGAVTVQTSYSVAMVTPLMNSIMGTVPISTQATMRAE